MVATYEDNLTSLNVCLNEGFRAVFRRLGTGGIFVHAERFTGCCSIIRPHRIIA